MYRRTYLEVNCDKLKNNIINIKQNYPDYEYSDYNCKVIPKKGFAEYCNNPFTSYIGDKTICPVCGNEHYDDKHTCYCRNCR